MRCAIDRFEGGFAVLQTEAGNSVNAPRAGFPAHCREGDWGEWDGAAFTPDPALTAAKRQANAERLRRLLGRK